MLPTKASQNFLGYKGSIEVKMVFLPPQHPHFFLPLPQFLPKKSEVRVCELIIKTFILKLST